MGVFVPLYSTGTVLEHWYYEARGSTLISYSSTNECRGPPDTGTVVGMKGSSKESSIDTPQESATQYGKTSSNSGSLQQQEQKWEGQKWDRIEERKEGVRAPLYEYPMSWHNLPPHSRRLRHVKVGFHGPCPLPSSRIWKSGGPLSGRHREIQDVSYSSTSIYRLNKDQSNTSSPTSTQAIASLGEEMDTTRSSTPETPTLGGSKKYTGVAQMKAAVWEFLTKYRPAKTTLVMETVSGLTTGDVTVEGITTMNLILGFANQVKALTVTVQNLAKTIQDQEQVIRGVARLMPTPRNKPEQGSSYARVAAQPVTETPGKEKRKYKSDEDPTPPKPPQTKAPKGDPKKDKGESKE
ncbi:hypothetical protein C7212DRAFT_341356 [Tuber magnatum]|uniref:Uncharacterized protein n=1 Tax=Tuber magnatum TaxID=42249 RepID=A0A317T5H9_9PEZI|nr:hypothetical protein C7212DRAFT_341356 [Tuber magnatum]